MICIIEGCRRSENASKHRRGKKNSKSWPLFYLVQIQRFHNYVDLLYVSVLVCPKSCLKRITFLVVFKVLKSDFEIFSIYDPAIAILCLQFAFCDKVNFSSLKISGQMWNQRAFQSRQMPTAPCRSSSRCVFVWFTAEIDFDLNRKLVWSGVDVPCLLALIQTSANEYRSGSVRPSVRPSVRLLDWLYTALAIRLLGRLGVSSVFVICSLSLSPPAPTPSPTPTSLYMSI